MHTLGIVGGIGPESTIDYYRSIVTLYAQRAGHAPSIIINSIDVDRLLRLVADSDRAALTDYVSQALSQLVSGGATVALLAANTPHLVFDELSARVSIPLISIVEATADEAERVGARKAALFGTRFTMNGGFYSPAFERKNIDLVYPSAPEQALIHRIYIEELLRGVVVDSSREELEAIMMAMRDRDGIDAVILAGTELSLIVKRTEYEGVTVMDTTQIHVRRAVETMLQ